jgi:DNA-binding transcriptional MocR family regulator
LSQRLQAHAISAAPQQIITTLGATHALDIASRSLLQPGDCVVVEEPGWTVEFARLTALGMRILPVQRTATGPDLAALRRYCEAANPADRPKLYVSVSVLHNPTGVSLSPAAAHQVLQLAHQHGFHVLEDDTYAHFAPDHATRMAALDCAPALQRVIYIGGFAKALAPNWRIGFLAAPQHLIERLTDTKMLSTLTTPGLLERALAQVITQGHMRRHCERLKLQLAAARSRSIKLALAHGCTLAAEPAGLFGWVDVGRNTDELAPKLLDSGYLIAPGSLFYAERRPTTLMRINFSTTQTPEFWQALAACV